MFVHVQACVLCAFAVATSKHHILAARGGDWTRAEDLPLARRIGSFAFVVTAYFFLTIPMDVWLRRVAIFFYGFFVSASVIWGPWLAELYPTHLRSTAASLFNYGRIVSFAAPPLTAALSTEIGLPMTMAIGAPCFILAAIVWWRLPETLASRATPAQVL